MKRTYIFIVGAALSALALAGAGCANSSNSANTSPETSDMNSMTTAPTGATASSGTTVSIAGFAFSPNELHAKVGDTITWTNNDSMSHTVTSDTDAFDSGTLAPGKTFTHTFTTAGTFAYHCNIHPSMSAKVIVE